MPPSVVNLNQRPIINSRFMPSPSTPAPRSFDLNNLMFWIKKTPECIGIGKRITNDILTPYFFTPIESPKKPGRPSKAPELSKIDTAMFFAKNNNFRQKAEAQILDWIYTGDMYLWMGRIDNSLIKETAIKHYKSYGIELKEIDIGKFLEGKEEEVYYDEDYNGISSIETVPSTQVRLKHDQHKILSYEQEDKQHPGTKIHFLPKSIIHGKFMDVDGSPYGYTPMEAAYTSIRTINAITDYSWYYFENGAKIDRVWKYMGNPNPEYWEKFQENVSKYISIKKAHGHLFVAGAEKIESETLNEISEKMEYRDLAIYSTGKLAFAFNMPADILSAVLGKDIKTTANSSDVEDAGYYRNIERSQEYVENLWNRELWIPYFKVEMHFKRTFKQDQIRQVQYMGQAISVIDFLQKNKFPLNDDYYLDLLQLDKEYLTGNKIEWAVEEEPQPFVHSGTQKGPNQQEFSKSKKQQQKPQQNNKPPTGV